MVSNSFSPDSKQRLRLTLVMPADWERIELVRQAVTLWIDCAFGDAELGERLAMVGSELLENAVKHSTSSQIDFLLEQEGARLTIAVRNQITDELKCAALLDRLRFIAKFPDPKDAYLSAMSAVYAQGARSQLSAGGTLGLVRIAYEGDCGLECDTAEPGFVTVRARHTSPAAMAPLPRRLAAGA